MSKIFVVDDQSSIREICQAIFSKDGHQVMTMPNGDQMISMLESEKPDLILMDLKMPGEEGLSLLRRLPLVDGKRLPVVIFSAHLSQELECEAYEAGVIDVITKDTGTPQLRYRINKILAFKDRIFGKAETVKGGKKILVVDDEPNIRKLLSDAFTRKGLRVYTAANGEDALKILEKQNPRMVLLDVTMPGMDGILILKQIKKFDPEIGVVMTTGVIDEAVAREAIQLGAYDYVTKPFDLRYLEVVVLRRLMVSSS